MEEVDGEDDDTGDTDGETAKFEVGMRRHQKEVDMRMVGLGKRLNSNWDYCY